MFAARSHGEALADPDPDAATFWDLLGADATTVQIYQRLAERERVPVPLLDVEQPRSSGVQVMCGWRNRARMPDGARMEVDDAIAGLGLFVGGYPPALSHGICERCLAEFTAPLDLADAEVTVVHPDVSITL